MSLTTKCCIPARESGKSENSLLVLLEGLACGGRYREQWEAAAGWAVDQTFFEEITWFAKVQPLVFRSFKPLSLHPLPTL